jgi:tetratricopeptide (TPR) repeat protein
MKSADMVRALLLSGIVLMPACARNVGYSGRGVFNEVLTSSPTALADAERVDAAQHLYTDGLFDRAREAVDGLLADGVRHPQVFMLKAQLLRQAGDLDGAISWCAKAVEASPAWVEPRVLAAQIHLARERYAAAASLFEDIDRLAPRGPWGAYGQAVVAAQRGDHAQAISFCERALERDPDHEPSIQLRAQLARLKGDTLGEERLLARYVALQPMDAEARVRLGELAQAAGRMEDARRQLMRAYELEPRPSTAAQLADLARLANDVDDERRWRQRSGAPLRNPDEEPVSQPLVQ